MGRLNTRTQSTTVSGLKQEVDTGCDVRSTSRTQVKRDGTSAGVPIAGWLHTRFLDVVTCSNSIMVDAKRSH